MKFISILPPQLKNKFKIVCKAKFHSVFSPRLTIASCGTGD